MTILWIIIAIIVVAAIIAAGVVARKRAAERQRSQAAELRADAGRITPWPGAAVVPRHTRGGSCQIAQFRR